MANRDNLKGYFKAGDRPTEVQFEELINNVINVNDDKASDTDAINSSNDTKYITPKTARKVIDNYVKVNNKPSVNGQVTIATSDIAGLDISINSKQASLVSGTNIKTINSQTLLGAGNIDIPVPTNITGNAGTATKLETARNINGIAFDGSANINIPLSNPFMGTDVSVITGGGATFSTLFCTVTTTGSLAAIGPAVNSFQRTKLSTTAVASNITGVKTINECQRGSIVNKGGFTTLIRFGLSAIQPGMISFVGLSSSASLAFPTTPVSPFNASIESKIGMAINTSTGNWKLVCNAGVANTTPTSIDLGTNFAVNTTNFYELYLSCSPNGTSIDYRVKNINNGAIAEGTITTTNLPSNAILLGRLLWLSNGTTAAVTSIDVQRWVLEKN